MLPRPHQRSSTKRPSAKFRSIHQHMAMLTQPRLALLSASLALGDWGQADHGSLENCTQGSEGSSLPSSAFPQTRHQVAYAKRHCTLWCLHARPFHGRNLGLSFPPPPLHHFTKPDCHLSTTPLFVKQLEMCLLPFEPPPHCSAR